MNSASSVTDWLRAMEGGNDDAARQLWERYSGQMHDVARRRMRRLKRSDIVDEEDIVVSAFASLCLAARRGQLAGVKDRNELWALMVVATLRKVGQRKEYTQAAKRDPELVLDQIERRDELGSGMQRLACDAPSPSSVVIRAERVEELLSKLNDPDLRAVALLRLAGHTNDQIAAEMGYTRRSIQRMLALIRRSWSGDFTDDE